MLMDALEGETLQERLRRGRLSHYDATRIAAEIADALTAVHSAGVVHRDLKPSNIFLAKQSDRTERVVLIDFGLATALGDRHLTPAGATIGTPMYMSPEQAQAFDIDARSDLYSLGATLFEMLTGQTVFPNTQITTLLLNVVMVTPPRLRSIDSTISAALDALVALALSKEPDTRVQSASAFAGGLQTRMLGAVA